MTTGRFVVPVSESVTLRNTVAHAVRRAQDSPDAEPVVHFVYPLARRLRSGEDAAATDVLERVAVWAREDLGGDDSAVTIETVVVGADQYLFGPGDYADIIETYARERGLDTVLLDPEFNPSGATPLLPPLEAELERAGLTISEAPVERQTRRPRLVRPGGLGQYLLLAGLSFAFYLLVSGSLAVFELATGAISAAVVATLLWRVSLTGPTRPATLLARVARMGLYVPYLLWEIGKANLDIAYVVLHPSLPIDPKMVEFDAAVWSELPVTTLANSITLTPGTLTVDVTRRHFTVHTLTGGAREDLFAGGLERAVRFVFYGRGPADIPSPRERGEGAESEVSDGTTGEPAETDGGTAE